MSLQTFTNANMIQQNRTLFFETMPKTFCTRLQLLFSLRQLKQQRATTSGCNEQSPAKHRDIII